MARELWALRTDIHPFYPSPETRKFWLWINTNGLAKYPDRLATLLPPVPPADLRARVSGDQNLLAHLHVGALTFEVLDEALAAVECHLPYFRRILDFGCGCARTLRFLQPYAREMELWGCDVDREAIQWCRDSLSFARFAHIAPQPPTPFEDQFCDFIYAVSIFTHLSEPNQRLWIEELRRLCPAGALVAVTTHGPHAWTTLEAQPELAAKIMVESAALKAAREVWKDHEFVFFPHPSPSAFVDANDFGFVFMTPEYIRRNWRHFEIIAYHPAALSDWQDLVLLRAV